MKNIPLPAVAAIIALGLLAHPASAQSYSFQDIGNLGGATIDGLGINASGQVVGLASTAAGANHAFLYDSNGIHDLGVFPGASTGTTRFQPSSGAVGINAAGQIAGFSVSTNRSQNAFLHTGSGMLTSSDDIGTPGTYSQGLAINDMGTVVGSASTSTGQHAFLYDGTMHDLGALRTTDSATARGINSAGQVVGISSDNTSTSGTSRAFRTSPGGAAINGATDDLGTLGGSNAYAVAINGVGTVVGYSNTTNGAEHGFATPTGRGISAATDDLGVLPGYMDSYASGINSAGLIVGYNSKGVTTTGMDISPIATLFTRGSWIDLNSFLPANSGYTLMFANSINDAGQILVVGQNSSGMLHTFILSPTPEPSSTAALGLGILGLAGLVFKARKRPASAA